MVEINSITRPPRHGLRGLWQRIRHSMLRLGPGRGINRRQLAPSRTASRILYAAAPEDSESQPVEPTGVKPRDHAALPTGGTHTSIRDGLKQVPPLPHVVRELLRELSDPSSNARTVARIAATDPALAAGLIRTVNSAAMGLRKKIASVTDAVSFLGYTTVRSLVIRSRLERVFPTHGLRAVYDAEDLWVHSLAVAYAAETLAERVPGVDRGFVSTLGLLHDIGKLAINSYFPHSAAQLRKSSPDHPGESFLDRERRVLGGDHAEIGAILARHWRLPAELIESIRWHHAPREMPITLSEAARHATILVHLANQLAKYCYVYSEDMEVDIVGADLLRQVGLPGPLTRLLGNQVRRAISRAVFFADESTAGGSGRSLGMVRRFLRLPAQGDVPADAPAPPFGRPYITQVDDAWDQRLPLESLRVDSIGAGKARSDRALANLGCSARFNASATEHGVRELQTVTSRRLDSLPMDEHSKLPARFVLRRLLTNLAEIGPAEPIEVTQDFSNGAVAVGVRSPALAFARRFGPDVSPRLAQAALVRELANVLNLRWFSRVQTSLDGTLLLFHSHPADA